MDNIKFDIKKPHSEVVGQSAARYYQNGKYFTATGVMISWDESARTAGQGASREVMTPEEQSMAAVQRIMENRQNTDPNQRQIVPKRNVEIVANTTIGMPEKILPPSILNPEKTVTEKVKDRRSVLEDMHFTEVKEATANLIDTIQKNPPIPEGFNEEAENFPATGENSKEKNIVFLLKWTNSG